MKTPLYKQIMDDMIDKINKQNMKPNDALESESELEKFYGVSNITVRKALNELEHSGVIYRVKGKGNFVAGNLMHPPNGGGFAATRVISLVVSDQQNVACMDTVAGASACVQQMRGYLLNVISSRTANLSGNELLERTCSSGSSGLIIWPSESNDSIAELCILSARRFPVVTIDQNLHLDHVDSVVSDNAKGVNAAVSYMIEKGHRQIGFISNMAMNGVGSIRERYAATARR